MPQKNIKATYAAMRFNGRDAVEARCNGSVVWAVGEPTDDRLRFVAEELNNYLKCLR